ncbi:hypothetical protein D3C77_231520 [compost metagenome]
MALHGLGRVQIAQEDDALSPQPRQVQRRAAPAVDVVRADRAIELVRQFGAPDDEARLGLDHAVEGGVQGALAQEDDAVGPAGGHGRGHVLIGGGRQVANDQVAAALARRLAHPGQKLQEEGIAEAALASLRARHDQGDGRLGPDRPGGHVAAERIVVLARQLPDQLLGPVVDRRMVVQRPRGGRDRHPRQPGQVFQSRGLAAQGSRAPKRIAAKFAANLALPCAHQTASGKSLRNRPQQSRAARGATGPKG